MMNQEHSNLSDLDLIVSFNDSTDSVPFLSNNGQEKKSNVIKSLYVYVLSMWQALAVS